MLLGSSFKSRLTLPSSEPRSFVLELTSFKALSNPTALPPISYVIPFIPLFAILSHLFFIKKIAL
jgi:hypothetical protein